MPIGLSLVGFFLLGMSRLLCIAMGKRHSYSGYLLVSEFLDKARFPFNKQSHSMGISTFPLCSLPYFFKRLVLCSPRNYQIE
jgi:hypothetical protein